MNLPPYHIILPAISSGSVYLFSTDSDLEYEVRFARKKDNLLKTTIAFGVLNEEFEGEEYVVTNRGEVYRVMNTIVEVVKTYMKEHPNVRSYEFTSEPTGKELGESRSKRMLLYERYLPEMFDDHWKFTLTGNKMVISRIDR